MTSVNSAKRALIKSLSLMTCSPMLLSPLSAFATQKAAFISEQGKIKPGIQLYSVRNDLASSSADTFLRLAKLGYQYVEWFDITTLMSQGPQAQKAGLEIASVHVLSPFLTGDKALANKHGLTIPDELGSVEAIAQLLQRFNIKFLVLSYLFVEERQSIQQYQQLAEHLQQAGKICQSYGVQLCYHNHEFELQPLQGQVPLEVIQERTSEQLLKFELDVYWLKFAGLDPARYIKQLGNRVSLLHLKDLSPKGTGRADFAPLGRGSVDLVQVIAAAEQAGVELCFVEQDQSTDIWRDLKISYDYLQTLMS